MAGLSVGIRLKNLKSQMQKACQSCGRDPTSVRLLAVSKKQSLDKIREASQCGLQDFAENYVQEAILKQEKLSDLSLRWHFIGRIQSNKVKLLAGKFFAIHSLDRTILLEQLNRLCADQGVTQNVFLQYNVASEASKGGADTAELQELAHCLKECANLRGLGLMVMPPLSAPPEEAKHSFKLARETLANLRQSFTSADQVRLPMNELSMGTSHDFELAIAEGATWIRIGTQLFGPRPGTEEIEESR